MNRTINTLSWEDARNSVHKVNKDLASIIDEMNPDSRYKLYEIQYLYGDLIVDDGITFIPSGDDNDLIALQDSKINKLFKEQLTYSQIPLFLIMNSDCEVFLDSDQRIIPLNLHHKGSLLGLFETMDSIFGYNSNAKWCVSSGSRTICMLPRITDNVYLKKLFYHFNIPSTIVVKKLTDHWELFKAIAQSPNFNQKWKCKVLMFGKEWFNDSSPAGMQFKNYLYRHAWRQAKLTLSKIGLNMNWGKYAKKIALRNLSPRPYLIDQVKHLLAIGFGHLPAFRPTDDSQQSAPTNDLKKAFLEVYQLKQYHPTIMHICNVEEIFSNKPLYYSLSFSTLFDGTTIDQSSNTLIQDMRGIKIIIDTLKPKKSFSTVDTDKTLDNIDFEYYHSESDKSNEIKLSKLIESEDHSFLDIKEHTQNKKFCETSPFFRGCIRIIRN